MKTCIWIASFAFASFCMSFLGNQTKAQEANIEAIKAAVLLHAPFDGKPDAIAFPKEGKLWTANALDRSSFAPGIASPKVVFEKSGKYGQCLRFLGKTKEVLCFRGEELGYQPQNWSGTLSFWMRLNPDQDLEPGYCDPIQMTQYGWDNGSFFVDFDKDIPRDFRLGAFSDKKFWNPKDIPWEKLPVEERPMVTVHKPNFSKERWTHVAFTYKNINDSEGRDSRAALFIDGKLMGELKKPIKMTWEPSKVALMIGIEYIGDIDDLILFRRDLAEREIELLSNLPKGLE